MPLAPPVIPDTPSNPLAPLVTPWHLLRDLSSTLSRLLSSISGNMNVLKTQIAGLTAEIARSKEVYEIASDKRFVLVLASYNIASPNWDGKL